MRSRSRSPRRGRSKSRERRVPVTGRLMNQERRNLKRTRSRSPVGKGREVKGREVGRSVSPKRRRSSPVDERRGAKHMEAPCKREADSTDMPHKSYDRKLSPRNRPGDSARKSHNDKASHRSRPGHRGDNSKFRGKKSPATETNLIDRADKKRGNSKSGGEKVRKEHSASKKHSSKPAEQTPAEDNSKFKAFDQTHLTMNDRFAALEGIKKPFVPEENVSIEIERAVEGRAVPFEMPLFWSDAVVIFRRPDEGKKPLTDRDEFRRRIEEIEEERRTVKVKKNVTAEKVDSRRDASDSRKKSDHHGHVESRRAGERRSPVTRSQRFEDEQNILRNARDLLISMKTTRNDAENRQRPPKRSVISASNVGRNYLLPAAAVMTGELPLHMGNLVNNREREIGRSMTMYNSAAAGRPSTHIPQLQQLPDFAHRPDKYQYEEWKNHPELIPKGRSYFEHDDRDAADDVWNGRGPRGLRGRGGGRGWGRGVFNRLGGGPRITSSKSDVWRHDKFDELSESPQPSSTS